MQHGYDGTSMQLIADAAGINKSLLHYYYRNKERLFRKVFEKVFSQFIPHLGVIFMSDMAFEDKIYAFAERYIEVFVENPLIPIFVMQELTKNPDRLATLVKESGINPELMISRVSRMLEEEEVEIRDPRHFFVNLLSLCVFPFAARPLIQRMLFNNDKQAYDDFLEDRKKEVPKFIINAIKKS